MVNSLHNDHVGVDFVLPSKIRHMNNNSIFFVLFLLISICSHAQTQKKPRQDSLTTNHSHVVTFNDLDQRKMYSWGNGTRATAAGREAGEQLPNYVKLIGNDSAIVVKDPRGDRWTY